ncbi:MULTISPECIES: hypothetical protein [Microbulbifer]|uniref:hypothetical protein n=1 Tax=Microbulbifer TaxID=48073 RepID=UPI001CD6329F|nr:hypothetical protein [Microbulbifer agarilyticus]MCA0899055.1 hypothetical protein [Microbulbifer agarilyticus]
MNKEDAGARLDRYLQEQNQVQRKLDRARAAAMSLWGWGGNYWFPLELDPTPLIEVLAIDGNKILPYHSEPDLEQFLVNFFHGEKIYFFQETGAHFEESEYSGFSFGYYETFACDSHLRNVVYWSHENTVTFGGRELVSQFKRFCPKYADFVVDWAKTYNK